MAQTRRHSVSLASEMQSFPGCCIHATFDTSPPHSSEVNTSSREDDAPFQETRRVFPIQWIGKRYGQIGLDLALGRAARAAFAREFAPAFARRTAVHLHLLPLAATVPDRLPIEQNVRRAVCPVGRARGRACAAGWRGDCGCGGAWLTFGRHRGLAPELGWPARWQGRSLRQGLAGALGFGFAGA